MIELQSFQQLCPEIRIFAKAHWENSFLTLLFEWQDPEALIVWNTEKTLGQQRRDGLWQNTCFELFLSEPGRENYFEFNLSSSGEWNTYAFTSYRQPQPPRATEEWQLVNFSRTQSQCQSRWQTLKVCPELELAFCSVIKTKTGSTHYFSSKHLKEKADFHWRPGMSVSLKAQEAGETQ